MQNEIVAKYFYCPVLDAGEITVYACYDSELDHHNRNVSFYDIYDRYGHCLNEGAPFYRFPSWQEIFDHYYMPTVN